MARRVVSSILIWLPLLGWLEVQGRRTEFFSRETGRMIVRQPLENTKNLSSFDISVNVYGDVAVVFTSQQESSRYAGTDTSGHYHFTDVWVKRSGVWQAVASHGSRFNDDN